MSEKIPLTAKVAAAIQQAMSQVADDDPDRFAEAAVAARLTMAEQLTAYVDAMGAACVKLNHRGAISPDQPCRACSPRIAHVKSIIKIVHPDD